MKWMWRVAGWAWEQWQRQHKIGNTGDVINKQHQRESKTSMLMAPLVSMSRGEKIYCARKHQLLHTDIVFIAQRDPIISVSTCVHSSALYLHPEYYKKKQQKNVVVWTQIYNRVANGMQMSIYKTLTDFVSLFSQFYSKLSVFAWVLQFICVAVSSVQINNWSLWE